MTDNIDELKDELDSPSEEEEEKEEDKEDKEEEEENEEEDEDIEEEDKTEEKKSEEKEEEEEQFSMPDKFKDKSPEEIAKSYAELEKMIEKKATEKANTIIKATEKKGEDLKDKEEEDKKEEGELNKMDFSKYTPNQFANYIDKRITEKAGKIAKQIITNSSKVRSTVRSDIVEAKKDHPRLKKDQEYTKLVVAVMESAASSGEKVGLKEACDQVDAFAGKDKKGENEEKIKKAQVELGGGPGTGGKKLTEEERIKENLLKGSSSNLGGLGI